MGTWSALASMEDKKAWEQLEEHKGGDKNSGLVALLDDADWTPFYRDVTKALPPNHL